MSSRKSRIRQNFVATMREQEGPTAFSEGASEPSYPVPDPFHEMEVKKLKEDRETFRKGFLKLCENSTAKISALKDELSTCRNESEQLKLKVTEIQDQLKVQGEVLAISDNLSEKVSCTVCFEILNNPYRHIFCGLCVAHWFAYMRESSCPECRATCVAHPQRDFALRELLPSIYFGLGKKMPTYEGLNATLFARIYAMLEECQTNAVTTQQQRAFWAPMLTEIREIRGADAPLPSSAPQPELEPEPMHATDADLEMGGDNVDSEWTPGSQEEEGDSEMEL